MLWLQGMENERLINFHLKLKEARMKNNLTFYDLYPGI